MHVESLFDFCIAKDNREQGRNGLNFKGYSHEELNRSRRQRDLPPLKDGHLCGERNCPDQSIIEPLLGGIRQIVIEILFKFAQRPCGLVIYRNKLRKRI
jgi:hypothetical protein